MSGEVIGETLSALGQKGMLHEGRLAYKIPFSVAWDKIVKLEEGTVDAVDS